MTAPALRFRISVDTGGTFTDVLVTGNDGRMTIGKALTTHARIFNGMREALSVAAAEIGLTLGELLAQTSLFTYGTTRATNATVTGKTARTALLVTRGFPDILVLREGGRANAHDFSQDFPAPYIPRRHTFEVSERTLADGTRPIPLDEADARRVIADLKAGSYEAVAVCFLWSIADAASECRMGELLEELLPGVPYTLSHRLLPVVREYRRASATAIDASLKPLMQEHLRGLERDLRASGYENDILVSTTVGGVMLIDELIGAPIHTVKSGPAMAPVAAATYSLIEGLGDNAIVCDTGGTTFDVGLVRDGELTYSRDTWLGATWTGHLLGISSVDIRSIGAGGGSIGWLDDGGMLRVGPQSAGSEPGPACYGRGGTLPTISDAACVLGYFNPDAFLGGRMVLDVTAARAAIEPLARRMSRSIEDTAWGMISIANELMIKAIHEITIAEGVNPRESTIVAGGGAAGINIMPIARELGCEKVILPKAASALSAAGMQFADIVKEETATLITTSAAFDGARVCAVLDDLAGRLRTFLATLGSEAASRAEIAFIAEARYLGQVWQLDTPIADVAPMATGEVSDLVEAFHRVHERVFAVRDPGSPVEFINWKARLRVALPTDAGRRSLAPAAGAAPAIAHRRCFFGAGAVETPIHRGADLAPGHRIEGPAIVEEATTTLVVYPGTAATVSPTGNYLLSCL